MKLNCKPGDLAVVVKSECGNEGKIVRCLRLANSDDRCMNGSPMSEEYGPWWFIDGLLHCIRRDGSHHMSNIARDEVLRPLRDSDGEDETFTWAGKPEEVKA